MLRLVTKIIAIEEKTATYILLDAVLQHSNQGFPSLEPVRDAGLEHHQEVFSRVPTRDVYISSGDICVELAIQGNWILVNFFQEVFVTIKVTFHKDISSPPSIV
jgi:hypothetical protein